MNGLYAILWLVLIFIRVRNLDAVIITHSHADAIGGSDMSFFQYFHYMMNKFVITCFTWFKWNEALWFVSCLGLDDLRDWTNNVQPSIPIYVAMRDFEVQLILQLS